MSSVLDCFDILFSLPNDSLNVILSVWLDPKCLSSLDIAYCHAQRRESLMTLFASPQFVMQTPERMAYDETFLTWLLARDIRVEKIAIDSNLNAKFLEYAERMGKSVKRISLKSVNFSTSTTNTELFCALLPLCPNVSALNLEHGYVYCDVLETIAACFTLTELTIGYTAYFSDTYYLPVQRLDLSTLIISHLDYAAGIVLDFTTASSLKALQVPICAEICAADVIAKLSPVCKLEALCMFANGSAQMNNEELVTLVEMCPNLRHFDFYSPNASSPTSTTRIATALQHLRSLRLHYCSYHTQLLLELTRLGCTTLEALFIEANVDDCGINAIAAQCKLKTLRMNSLPWDNFERLQMSALSSLTSLIVALQFPTRDFWEPTAYCFPHVTYLAIGNEEFYRNDYVALHNKDAFPKLQKLDIFAKVIINTDALKAARPELIVRQYRFAHHHIFERVIHTADYFPYKHSSECDWYAMPPRQYD